MQRLAFYQHLSLMEVVEVAVTAMLVVLLLLQLLFDAAENRRTRIFSTSD